ncbi:MAG: TonB-dependent siderophore receptor [Dechloromonas sp.]|nr:TonB-dependent siderophore receptor [Dechloromonas sp.]
MRKVVPVRCDAPIRVSPRNTRRTFTGRGAMMAVAISVSAGVAEAETPVLPEVTVVDTSLSGPPVEQTTAGPVRGYQALTAVSATRTPTPLEEIPQSIQVITRQLMSDQNNLTVSDALRNVSGVQGTNPLQTPAYNSTYIRGFAAEQWIDGMTTFYNGGNRDSLINAERIEVLKGPSAILYGGGSGSPVGGVVNIVSKLPTSSAFYNAGIVVGSHSYYQPYFDVNQPLNADGTVLFRMTGAYTGADSFIDVLNTSAYSVSPTLMFTNNSDTRLILQAQFTDWRQQEYQALPATGTLTGGFRIANSLFPGPADIPKSYSKTTSGTVQLEHTFDKVWSGSIKARASKTEYSELAQNYVGTDFAANTPSFPPSFWNLLNLDLSQEQTEFSVTANMLAQFDYGVSRNKVVFGLDYSRVKDQGYMLADFNDFFTLGFVDLASPNPAFQPYVRPSNTPMNTVADGDNTYTTTGAYVQLQSTIWDRLNVLAALRVANLKIDSYSPVFMRSDVTDTTKVLPRIGVAYEVAGGVSVFAGYSEGMKGNPFIFYAGTPKPEESKQLEGGVKFNTVFGLSGSAALFQIDRTGVPVSVGLASVPEGEQRSRGFDMDLLWQPNRNWQVLANYAHINATLTNAVPGVAPAGNQLNIVPENSGRLWVNYRFGPGTLEGWRIGAGIYAASSAYVDLANQFTTSGYYTADATVGYESRHFDISVTGRNLTGQDYYVPYNYYGGRVAPGDDRSVFANLALKF